MYGNSLDFVSTSNLSVPKVFHVPDLSYNLCFVGQLAELSYHLIFDYFGSIVQDPRKPFFFGLRYMNLQPRHCMANLVNKSSTA